MTACLFCDRLMKGYNQIATKTKLVKIIIVNEQRYNVCTDGQGLNRHLRV